MSPIDSPSVEELHRELREELRPHFDELAQCGSTRELHAHPRYRDLKSQFERIFRTPERGDFTPGSAEKKDEYRIVRSC